MTKIIKSSGETVISYKLGEIYLKIPCLIAY